MASREELERRADAPGGAGVPHSGVAEVPPGAMRNVTDPDGIALALFRDRG